MRSAPLRRFGPCSLPGGQPVGWSCRSLFVSPWDVRRGGARHHDVRRFPAGGMPRSEVLIRSHARSGGLLFILERNRRRSWQESGCAQCAHPGLRIGSYWCRTRPDCRCFGGSPVFAGSGTRFESHLGHSVSAGQKRFSLKLVLFRVDSVHTPTSDLVLRGVWVPGRPVFGCVWGSGLSPSGFVLPERASSGSSSLFVLSAWFFVFTSSWRRGPDTT